MAHVHQLSLEGVCAQKQEPFNCPLSLLVSTQVQYSLSVGFAHLSQGTLLHRSPLTIPINTTVPVVTSHHSCTASGKKHRQQLSALFSFLVTVNNNQTTLLRTLCTDISIVQQSIHKFQCIPLYAVLKKLQSQVPLFCFCFLNSKLLSSEINNDYDRSCFISLCQADNRYPNYQLNYKIFGHRCYFIIITSHSSFET